MGKLLFNGVPVKREGMKFWDANGVTLDTTDNEAMFHKLAAMLGDETAQMPTDEQGRAVNPDPVDPIVPGGIETRGEAQVQEVEVPIEDTTDVVFPFEKAYADIRNMIVRVRALKEEAGQSERGRCLAIAVTKLQEAAMWFEESEE